MRTAFIEELFDLARNDDRVNLVVADLGFGVVTPFAEELPEQFVNVGVAEQNMTGVAVGMALTGRNVFTYTIGNFATLRCLEQVRNDVCYHQANVTIVAVGGGMTYGPLGFSHHATEDIAILRALPNLVVMAPGDPLEAKFATRAAYRLDGPCYLRLGRAGEPEVHTGDIDFRLGKAITVRQGDDLTLVVTGALLSQVVAAADALSERGVSARVLSMHTIKPLDEEALLKAAGETAAVITIEEHNVIGGLGGAVAEVLAENPELAPRFRRIGIDDTFCSKAGSQDFLRAEHGLDVAGILRTVESVIDI